MTEPWWQTGVVYQIYPRSFADAAATAWATCPASPRLDYVASLGVDAIWLSPIFRSPMADFGYDISDYRDVDPLFGTLEDLDALVEEAHSRDLRSSSTSSPTTAPMSTRGSWSRGRRRQPQA